MPCRAAGRYGRDASAIWDSSPQKAMSSPVLSRPTTMFSEFAKRRFALRNNSGIIENMIGTMLASPAPTIALASSSAGKL